MDELFVLIVYDISNDRRRTKLHNLLLDYGTPVQYSVFECRVNAPTLEKMKKAIQKLIRPKEDDVRYYFLCAACQKKAEVSHGEAVAAPPRAWVA